jgi:hypothetical protein
MFEKPYLLETNPDTLSRVVVGSKATMPSDAGMKPPKQTELSSPEIETDLSRIQSLSREHDEENWEFRSWLKQNAPDNIDGIVEALSQKYFALIDCTQCEIVADHCKRNSRKASFTLLQKLSGNR